MIYFSNKFSASKDDAKTIFITQSLCGLDQVFDYFKNALSFPYPYSTELRFNYYAFCEIMEELNWLPETVINICHKNLPALNEEELGGNYLDALNIIDVRWEKFYERAKISKKFYEEHPEKFMHHDGAAWWDNKPKIFNVYFRKQDEQYVKTLLSKYSWDYRKCIHYDEKGDEQIDFKKRYPINDRLF